MTEMLTKSGGGGYNIHFRTDNPEAYKTVQEICRLFIDKERLTPSVFCEQALDWSDTNARR